MSRNHYKFVNGKWIGFGSFFLRKEFDCSEQEFYQSRGHDDIIRTADFTEADCKNRSDNDDDSHRISDWQDRTGIHRAWSFAKHAHHAKLAEEALRESRIAKESTRKQAEADKKKANADTKRQTSITRRQTLIKRGLSLIKRKRASLKRKPLKKREMKRRL